MWKVNSMYLQQKLFVPFRITNTEKNKKKNCNVSWDIFSYWFDHKKKSFKCHPKESERSNVKSKSRM